MRLTTMTFRSLLLASLAASACSISACSTSGDAVTGDEGVAVDDITQVDHTSVKRQSIGNCWLYATASWLEALHQGATGEAVNTSESYLTYWHWFDQITNGGYRDEISTGGTYQVGTELVLRYGLTLEQTFIPEESEAEMSNRQSAALDAINLSLKSGVLADRTARRDRKIVRAELDKAWRLSDEVKAKLDTVFGPAVERTLDRATGLEQTARDAGIILAKDFDARLKDPTTGDFVKGNLADAIGKPAGGFWGERQGKLAFNSENYPYDAASRRQFQIRVQKALHDGFPIVISWKVDFNALSRDSKFSMDELARRGAGKQGGHMTVLHDYEAEVPGLGLLKAGETLDASKPEDAAKLEAALGADTQIKFFRTKNSWGGLRPDRWTTAAIQGYHDLEMPYLDGPIKDCGDKDGNVNPEACTRDAEVWWDAVLPAGY